MNNSEEIERLFISYSGGRTSAMMTKLLLDNPPPQYKEICVVFANTGQEHEETLKFVNLCERWFDYPVHWVEAVINPEKRKGTRHKIVNFETASRKGEPFEAMIKKYGIPNPAGMFCTRELKLQTMTSYMRSIGWKKNTYDVAIGIRFDEMDRVSKYAIENKIVYPLIDMKITKKDVLEFWRKQDFNLMIPEHLGNCTWCWKKSKRKLLTIAKNEPAFFEFPVRMERMYGRNGNHSLDEDRKFFRKRQSALEILEESKSVYFDEFTDEYFVSMSNFDEELDSAGGCSESCEVY